VVSFDRDASLLFLFPFILAEFLACANTLPTSCGILLVFPPRFSFHGSNYTDKRVVDENWGGGLLLTWSPQLSFEANGVLIAIRF